jgi:hypothetical protein
MDRDRVLDLADDPHLVLRGEEIALQLLRHRTHVPIRLAEPQRYFGVAQTLVLQVLEVREPYEIDDRPKRDVEAGGAAQCRLEHRVQKTELGFASVCHTAHTTSPMPKRKLISARQPGQSSCHD